MINKELTFLQESNYIEDVRDDQSLADAVRAWNYLKNSPQLTIDVVLKTHGILMCHKTDELDQSEIGAFRQSNVYIGNRMGRPWYAVPELMTNWVRDVQYVIDVANGMPHDDRESVCKHFHVQYEIIHPFIDGNGRTGRMFMNYQRLKMDLPILIIYESKKYDYYKWFDVKQK